MVQTVDFGRLRPQQVPSAVCTSGIALIEDDCSNLEASKLTFALAAMVITSTIDVQLTCIANYLCMCT